MKRYLGLRPVDYSRGFTIIELLIASTVFSVVLLLCTTGMLQIGKVYYKGIVSTQAQEASRSIIEEISRTIQFSGGQITRVYPVTETGKNSDYFCVGDKSYSFLIDKQLSAAATLKADQSRHVLVSDTCGNGGQSLGETLPSGAKEFMAPNMRLAWLDLQNLGNNLYNINIRVVYGDTDVLNDTRDGCSSEKSGSQFCAASELSTSVQKRVK